MSIQFDWKTFLLHTNIIVSSTGRIQITDTQIVETRVSFIQIQNKTWLDYSLV